MSTVSVPSTKILARALQQLGDITYTDALARIQVAAAEQARVAKAQTVADSDTSHAHRLLTAALAHANVETDVARRYQPFLTPASVVEATCGDCRARVEVRDFYIAVRPAHNDDFEICGVCDLLDNADLDGVVWPDRRIADDTTDADLAWATSEAMAERYLDDIGVVGDARPPLSRPTPFGDAEIFECIDCGAVHSPDRGGGRIHVDVFVRARGGADIDGPCRRCGEISSIGLV